ncbi:hypothetical protein ACUY3K_06725 [Corynebacterium uberis]|uniref:hypothetical protein n=1 Tax=Corynebacterium TaxID=1716 RepID=UPI001D0A6D3E|nr:MULTISPECIES: hypothetical protein [Corynebacterium]MCZ9308814.1 hypothetical protein [Corynebacterium sp. c6VSa_13]UDL72658.1 hypothetical protein LH391_05860 [Corynebacterium uberis]UDL76466.1 hypothetical protein LH393_03545 [Corynebacterium uberis]UDL78678.1 hypothetical protein LH394_03530 [Corynebacterium uberis]UDL80957.1 hypothetical protein LH392_03955 [Corynebacterium uberis]
MLHAASFALLDSVNVLLIGVLVALGIALPARGAYAKVAALLVAGDWFGVLSLALFSLFVFGGLEQLVQRFMDSPAFGGLLIAVGVVSVLATLRAQAESTSALVRRLIRPLRRPGPKVPVVGFVLGVVQSVTSVPFFGGIAYVSVSGFPVWASYVSMIAYASVALSLPALAAVAVGWVRRYPYSPVGRLFSWARDNREMAIDVAGYGVGVALVVMGVAALL